MRALVLGLTVLVLSRPATGGPEADLVLAGSDTAGGLLTLWAEALREREPGLRIEIRGRGNRGPAAAVVRPEVDVVGAGRRLTREEVGEVREALGFVPVSLPVAVEAVAVVVHPSNPVQELTREDLARIFGAEDPAEG